MLPGTEIGAAVTVMESLGVDVMGLNCATGPEEMYEAVRYLTRNATSPVSIIHNAGLPSVVDGEMHYDPAPDDMTQDLKSFVEDSVYVLLGAAAAQHLNTSQRSSIRCDRYSQPRGNRLSSPESPRPIQRDREQDHVDILMHSGYALTHENDDPHG